MLLALISLRPIAEVGGHTEICQSVKGCQGRALLVSEWSMSGTRWAKPLHGSSAWVSSSARLRPASLRPDCPAGSGACGRPGQKRPSGGGVTALHELHAAGVATALASDNVRDQF